MIESIWAERIFFAGEVNAIRTAHYKNRVFSKESFKFFRSQELSSLIENYGVGEFLVKSLLGNTLPA